MFEILCARIVAVGMALEPGKAWLHNLQFTVDWPSHPGLNSQETWERKQGRHLQCRQKPPTFQ